MEKLLTIVIPVYKVEAYINKCLDSLIIDPALMEKMDVLIVNDGTPDNSAEMSREYVKRFPGVFRQIDKENGGHGSVWNLGVREAYGKYVKFLDSDDWLENLDVMVRKLAQTDADLIITSCIAHCPGDVLWKLEIKDMEFDHVYDADKFDWLGNRSHWNYIFHHCAIYKTEMFRQYLPLFLEKQPYDDSILGAAPIIGAKTLVAWDLEVYHYLMDREGQSISSAVQMETLCLGLPRLFGKPSVSGGEADREGLGCLDPRAEPGRASFVDEAVSCAAVSLVPGRLQELPDDEEDVFENQRIICRGSMII